MLAFGSIEDLQIPDLFEVHQSRRYPVSPRALAADIRKPHAYISKGSIAVCAADLSGQNREDVLHSTLLAQLVADKQIDREANPVRWTVAYSDVLKHLGWDGTRSQFATYVPKFLSTTLVDAILDLALETLAGRQSVAVVATFDALRALSGTDGRRQLFEQSAMAMSVGKFQINLFTQPAGVPRLDSLMVHYSVDCQASGFDLFRERMEHTRLQFAFASLQLDPAVYAASRQAVIGKLDDNPTNLTLELDL
ncbi:hypothetical protein [Qingshengfaniella alkalisoli]|uniref:Uncharacterized protein n=1 Tax=Qingshengfaniella alkalisoli TaxID=2599296 RepID=A0A5B8J9B2_9RHOB|nr:hypothetical protein [Qingshengfaniella alkalisoli]QDY70840.1 hypothetical protein FPZ52_14115 [Qingshengfaniella alkalisoli]